MDDKLRLKGGKYRCIAKAGIIVCHRNGSKPIAISAIGAFPKTETSLYPLKESE
jgi:hypothetical protein